MADSTRSPQTSIGLLLHEIEATPQEYWTELLDTLRQKCRVGIAHRPFTAETKDFKLFDLYANRSRSVP
jgi:hypothetical protein